MENDDTLYELRAKAKKWQEQFSRLPVGTMICPIKEVWIRLKDDNTPVDSMNGIRLNRGQPFPFAGNRPIYREDSAGRKRKEKATDQTIIVEGKRVCIYAEDWCFVHEFVTEELVKS